MSDPFLLAGRFGAATRLSPKALRLYAEHGLLEPAYVDPDTGYRYYAAEQQSRARLIARLRQLGLPVARVGRLVEMSPNARALELRSWLAAENEWLAKQTDFIEAMTRQATGGETALLGMVGIRDAPATKMIYRQRHVGVEALDSFMGEAEAHIRGYLKANGLPDNGRMSVLFHDLVTRDADGLVEVAIAYVGSIEPDGDLRLRFQPAQCEVFLPAQVAYEDFPMVLRVYDALETWLDARGDLICADSPFEAYPGADGARFDVAYPITSRRR